MTEPIFQIKKKKQTADYGQFVIEPLEQGYGDTLGNALRRVLLSSIPGAAVTQVKIAGVKHQFTTLEGLKEDIIELILNLKELQLAYQGKKPIKLTLEVEGARQIKAGEIKTPSEVKIINQDHVLANLAGKKSRLKMDLIVEAGLGYSPAEERKTDKLGVIPLDASFSPIRRVSYKVESTRVGRRTDLDRLILEITTNGAIKPSQALKTAAETLLVYFKQIISPKKAVKVEKKKESLFLKGLSDLTVEELELPTRIANALRKGGYGTLADLMAASRPDLGKVKNLGEKSIKVVEAALGKKGVNLKGS